MKQILFTLLFVGVLGSSNAQLNSYKYIVIPKKFTIFKTENQYQTSTLIKYLFTSEGYNAIYNDAQPPDLIDNPCLGLYLDLEKISTLSRTKTVLNLKDCNGLTVMRSPEGASKIKEYKEAYHEAIRGSFVFFQEMEYEYKPPTTTEEPVTASFQNDIKTVEPQEMETAVEEAAVVTIATPEERYYKDQRPVESDYTISETPEIERETEEASGPVYLARKTSNGYELLDGQNKFWLTLFETSTPEVYLARNEKENGMVYKKESKWYFEYYENSELMVQEILIKFQ